MPALAPDVRCTPARMKLVNSTEPTAARMAITPHWRFDNEPNGGPLSKADSGSRTTLASANRSNSSCSGANSGKSRLAIGTLAPVIAIEATSSSMAVVRLIGIRVSITVFATAGNPRLVSPCGSTLRHGKRVHPSLDTRGRLSA